jgi:membrane associated rhomboid family serine protease
MSSRRRTSIVFGLVFLVIGVAYGAFAPVFGYDVEWAGVTMLVALGAAMALMTYVLTVGTGD